MFRRVHVRTVNTAPPNGLPYSISVNYLNDYGHNLNYVAHSSLLNYTVDWCFTTPSNGLTPCKSNIVGYTTNFLRKEHLHPGTKFEPGFM